MHKIPADTFTCMHIRTALGHKHTFRLTDDHGISGAERWNTGTGRLPLTDSDFVHVTAVDDTMILQVQVARLACRVHLLTSCVLPASNAVNSSGTGTMTSHHSVTVGGPAVTATGSGRTGRRPGRRGPVGPDQAAIKDLSY